MISGHFILADSVFHENLEGDAGLVLLRIEYICLMPVYVAFPG